MSLTAYSGISNPTPTVTRANNAAAMPAGTSVPTAGTTISMRVGDRAIIWIAYNSSTASVSSVANTGTALTWTRLGSITTQGTNRYEIWYSSASTVQQSTAVTMTMSVSVTSYSIIQNITGFPGVPETPVVNSGSSTTPTSNGPIPATSGNALLLWNQIHANTSTDGPVVTNPYGIFTVGGAAGNGFNGDNMYVQLEGIPNATPTMAWGTITTGVWFASGVSVPGPTVTLDDLTYILRDDGSGVLLNDPSDVTPPIYDVDKITGLDNSTVNSSSSQIDGAHGSYIQAKFLTGKTVVMDCHLFATAPVDESLIDNLKYNWRPAPSSTPVPFFYKLPSKPLRWIAAKPFDLQCDFDPARSYGVIPFQVQFGAPDPRSYSLPNLRIQNTPTSGSQFDDSAAVGGNIESYPLVYFYVTAAEVTNSVTLDFSNQTIGVGTVRINCGVLQAGGYVLDLGARTVTQISTATNPDYSSSIVNRQWWYLVPGLTNAIRLVRTGTGASTTQGFAWSYMDAWR